MPHFSDGILKKKQYLEERYCLRLDAVENIRSSRELQVAM